MEVVAEGDEASKVQWGEDSGYISFWVNGVDDYQGMGFE